jgi:hypothetical protein
MQTKEVIKFLKNYNKWRRSENRTIKIPDPIEIGIAIDEAIKLLENKKR